MGDDQSPLISVAQLDALIRSGAPVTLVDIRWDRQDPPPALRFLQGHLPGAVRADLDADLAGPPGAGGRHPLPSVEEFGAAMRRLGVHADRPVVAYDQRDGTIASRLWWMLRHHGHEDARVLDGGLEAWVRAGLPVESGPAGPIPVGDFVAAPGRLPVVTVGDVQDLADRGHLLDSRLGERFRGEVEPLDPVAGHIPGAVSAPTFDNTTAEGLFRSPEALRERFERLGLADGKPVAAYCGSGVTAAHQVLALQLAGFDAALYVGSWSEWVCDPSRAVATGP